jgi:hypothetical protein
MKDDPQHSQLCKRQIQKRERIDIELYHIFLKYYFVPIVLGEGQTAGSTAGAEGGGGGTPSYKSCKNN